MHQGHVAARRRHVAARRQLAYPAPVLSFCASAATPLAGEGSALVFRAGQVLKSRPTQPGLHPLHAVSSIAWQWDTMWCSRCVCTARVKPFLHEFVVAFLHSQELSTLASEHCLQWSMGCMLRGGSQTCGRGWEHV